MTAFRYRKRGAVFLCAPTSLPTITKFKTNNMEAAIATPGGGIKVNIAQLALQTVVLIVIILLMARVLKLNVLDNGGGTVYQIKPKLNI